jgi:hypothetical protein
VIFGGEAGKIGHGHDSQPAACRVDREEPAATQHEKRIFQALDDAALVHAGMLEVGDLLAGCAFGVQPICLRRRCRWTTGTSFAADP